MGDAARIYLGDELVMDNFYNGDPLPFALWRIPAADWPKLRLKVLPYSDQLHNRLPDVPKKVIDEAQAAGTLDKVSATAKDVLEVSLKK